MTDTELKELQKLVDEAIYVAEVAADIAYAAVEKGSVHPTVIFAAADNSIGTIKSVKRFIEDHLKENKNVRSPKR